MNYLLESRLLTLLLFKFDTSLSDTGLPTKENFFTYILVLFFSTHPHQQSNSPKHSQPIRETSYFAPERTLGKIELEAHYKETSKEKLAIKLKLRLII